MRLDNTLLQVFHPPLEFQHVGERHRSGGEPRERQEAEQVNRHRNRPEQDRRLDQRNPRHRPGFARGEDCRAPIAQGNEPRNGKSQAR